MPLASASIADRSGLAYRPAGPGSPLLRLRRLLLKQRHRRLERAVAETVLTLGHAGIAEDYRAACGRR